MKMPRPKAPPTPSSSADLKSRDDSSLISSRMSFELPPPAIAFDSHPSSTSSDSSSSSSYYSPSPMSNPLSPPAVKSRAAAAARKRSVTTDSNSKGTEAFSLPPPPTRTRKIIQMKPSTAPTNEPSVGEQPAKTAANKRKAPSATSAAGRKMARKTAHSLIERRRRSKMNEEFGVLKDMIPACKGEMHKLAILQASIEYVRYLEDCIVQLKEQNGRSTPTAISPRDSHSDTRSQSYGPAFGVFEGGSHTDSEMTAPPPTFPPPHQFPQHQHAQQHHHHQQQQQQPSVSPPLRPEDFQRTRSFTHWPSISPALGPQAHTGLATWHGSAASSALTSPALGPMAEEETATVALMMLNGDWRTGSERERIQGEASRAMQRPGGMSVKDLLST